MNQTPKSRKGFFNLSTKISVKEIPIFFRFIRRLPPPQRIPTAPTALLRVRSVLGAEELGGGTQWFLLFYGAVLRHLNDSKIICFDCQNS